MAPKISVIMPVFNSQNYLREAIESILNQTFRDFEFIIINDASTDESLNIINSYNDSRIQVIDNSLNKGAPLSLNLGLQLASGEYIARMDADDISFPERFSKQVEYLDQNFHISVLGTNVIEIDQKGKPITGYPSKYPSDPNLIRWLLLFKNCLRHPTVMARRSFFEAVGVFNDEWRPAADYHLWLRAAYKYSYSNLTEALLYYRWHDTNVSVVNLNQSHKGNILRQKYIWELFNIDAPLDIVAMSRFHGERIDALKATSLIEEIYTRFIKLYNPSAKIRNSIKKDICTRQIRYAILDDDWKRSVKVLFRCYKFVSLAILIVSIASFIKNFSYYKTKFYVTIIKRNFLFKDKN